MLNRFNLRTLFSVSQDSSPAQAQLKTWPVILLVLLTAISASGVIYRLNQVAENSNQTRLLLSRTKEQVSRLNSLEWEALSKRVIDENLSEELAEYQEETEAILKSLQQIGRGQDQLDTLLVHYDQYQAAVYGEIELIDQGKIDEVLSSKATEIDEFYDDLYAEISTLEYISIEERKYTQALANTGTTASLILSAIAIGLLFHGFSKELWSKNKRLKMTLQELEQTQHQMIQQEKMVALGQLIAGIAHEINNPLGVIKASANNIQSDLQKILTELPQLHQKLDPDERESFFRLIIKTIDNRPVINPKEQRSLKRKLSSQLKEQEISNARYTAELLMEMGLEDVPEFLMPLLKGEQSEWAIELASNLTNSLTNNRMIQNAVDRSSKIVFALKNYARFEQNSQKKLLNVENSLDIVLELYQNQIKHKIQLVRDYEEGLPEILGDSDELVQVWTNLIHNSIQAMPKGGTLTIQTRTMGKDGIEVSVSDTGGGISEDIQTKIFEAFFTTKSAGEGSGLGLYISRNIIDKHYGEINVKSRLGYTQFTVWLPANVVLESREN